jgi:hypothetical protein
LYRRRETLFGLKRWAAEMPGFSPTSEHPRRSLTGFIKQESYKALSAASLVTFARRWFINARCYVDADQQFAVVSLARLACFAYVFV